uniref:IRG-type G domain-containing protein n=1 Tax=Poecilia reticulata TaxID=8081 RepID=A0A3P9N9K1_POERE
CYILCQGQVYIQTLFGFTKNNLKETDSIPLNIAVTGEPGTGKSTFVNAFRGINNNGEGAAPTGCENTTTNPTSYRHPDYNKVIIWDLPGIGSTMWPADKYERIELEKFDFFIILSADRFRENDVKLVKEIQKMGKKFYFVRSKVSYNLRDEERSQMDFTEEKVLETINEDWLKEQGIESPQVFLLRFPDVSLQGLKELKTTFEEELPDLKRHALCLDMDNLYLQVLNNKKENFRAKIKYYSLISATGAIFPVPLLSAGVDLSSMCLAFRQSLVEFGLDTSSLKKLHAATGISCNDEITNLKFNNKLLKSSFILIHVANTSVIASTKEGVVSRLRILVAPILSFTTTYVALNGFVTELAEKSHRIFKRALGLNT